MKVIIGEEIREYQDGITYEVIASDYQEAYQNTIALVVANGKIRELHKKAFGDQEISFLTYTDTIGHKAYVRTVTMIFLKAATEVIGKEVCKGLKIEFAIGHGYYCSKRGDFEITDELVNAIQKRMEELVEQKMPIKKKSYPMDEAIQLMEENGMQDKVKLFRYRRSSSVNLYNLDGYLDYYYGYMLPDTGYAKSFRVIPYDEGFMLLMPERKNPHVLPPFVPREKLFHVLKETAVWTQRFGIETVGDLNNCICSGEIYDIIMLQEAEQERKIGEIAKEIVSREHVKFIMIAGPSSSGKTSFANRLSIQLKSLGKKPHLISLDDYFVDRELTPRDEKGDYNFECLGAIDVEGFNRDMLKLLNGETVEIPSFNFKIGKREYDGNVKHLSEDDVLVIEGIHGLNPKMSHALPEESKFKIYISALTSLNIDDHNRIPTTDGRLLRRMVRDARTRGASAKRTLQMWGSVRKGEEENIFPFQEEADVMFNSVLMYELAVLKQYAEPLLFSIQKGEPEYFEAKRLLRFLNYFLGIDSTRLPNNSICREFVGGSCFKV